MITINHSPDFPNGTHHIRVLHPPNRKNAKSSDISPFRFQTVPKRIKVSLMYEIV